MIELITNNGSIKLTKPTGGGIAGKDGGYYIPYIDTEGNLSWSASEPGMPPVEAVNIKGPQGESGVYVGSGEMPEGYNIQIDLEGETADLDKLATKEYVSTAINEALGVIENGTY